MARSKRHHGTVYAERDAEGHIVRWRGELSLKSDTTGRRQRKRVSGKSERAVQDTLDGLYRDWLKGELSVGPSQTVKAFLETWLAGQHQLSPRTHDDYRKLVAGYLLPALGKHKLDELKPEHIQRLYSALLGRLAPRTVQHIHACLHAALEAAVKWGNLTRNPASVVYKPKVGRSEMHAWDLHEAQRFLSAVQDGQHEAYWVLAITTGMRSGELRALKWTDVDLEAGSIRVQRAVSRVVGRGLVEKGTKTESGRPIPLMGQAIEALRRQRLQQKAARLKAGARWQESGLVFTSEIGTPLHESNLARRCFYPLLERAGLPRIRPYDLRHSTASLYLALGTHPKIVQELLGHASVRLTLDTYSHAGPTLARDAVEKLEKALRSG